MHIRPRLVPRAVRPRRGAAVLVAALALFPLTVTVPADAAAPPIIGTVVDASGAGLRDVCVAAYDSAGRFVSFSNTDDTGGYALTDALPSGAYRVGFADCGLDRNLVTEYYRDGVDLASADAVAVTAGSTVTIDAQLEAGGSISGTVTVPPTVDVTRVCADAYDAGGRIRASNRAVGDGTYYLAGVPTGVIRVRFYSGSDCLDTSPAPIVAPEWYDDQGTFAAAATITVAVGTHTTGVDATLVAPGTLPDTAITGGPAQGATVATAGTGFTFTGTNASTGFQCSLDGAAFTACTSPSSYAGLATGTHGFAVRAVNAAGPDATPAARTFIVDRSTSPGCLVATGSVASATAAVATAQASVARLAKLLKKARKRGPAAKKKAKKKLKAAGATLAAAQTTLTQTTTTKNGAC